MFSQNRRTTREGGEGVDVRVEVLRVPENEEQRLVKSGEIKGPGPAMMNARP